MSIGRAMRGVPLAKRWWASKQMSGHFAHGKNMARWKQRSSAECPRCGNPTEDKAHITRCPSDTVNILWEEAITALTEWMKAEQTDPQLVQEMVAGHQAW